MKDAKLISLRTIAVIGLIYGYYCVNMFSNLHSIARHVYTNLVSWFYPLDYILVQLAPIIFAIILVSTFVKIRISTFTASMLGVFIAIYNLITGFLIRIPKVEAYYATNPEEGIRYMYSTLFANFEQHIINYKASLIIFPILFIISTILSRKKK